ncbi:MAG: bifunctional 5,10-methylenetetrahydrofolate dehydrogenase/5,10-methenyltetrahydrofolate cyclohydrolase [Acidobacteriota bacterium]
METRKLLGKITAEAIKSEVAEEVNQLKNQGIIPGLATVLVGEDPASEMYVGSKVKTCRELGMHSELVRMPASTTQGQLLKMIEKLNSKNDIDGILVQLPLPGQIDETPILEAIRPDKDVDGFHPVNTGKLMKGETPLAPCTPMGVMEMLAREKVEIKGAEAVIVGRSNIVGKPMALLMLHKHATVTLCHSRSRDLPGICRRADILIVAVGRPAMITREYIREGAVVVDVGTNRITSMDQVVELFGPDSPRIESFKKRGSTVVGDVHPRAPYGIASAVTPVPGGVGPLTIAHLMKNTLIACKLRRASLS